MRREHDRVPLRVQPANKLPQLLTQLHVDPGGRFVEDDDFGFVHQRLRDHDAPLHPAGKRRACSPLPYP